MTKQASKQAGRQASDDDDDDDDLSRETNEAIKLESKLFDQHERLERRLDDDIYKFFFVVLFLLCFFNLSSRSNCF